MNMREARLAVSTASAPFKGLRLAGEPLAPRGSLSVSLSLSVALCPSLDRSLSLSAFRSVFRSETSCFLVCSFHHFCLSFILYTSSLCPSLSLALALAHCKKVCIGSSFMYLYSPAARDMDTHTAPGQLILNSTGLRASYLKPTKART